MRLASLLGVSEQAENILLECEREVEPLFTKVQEWRNTTKQRC